MSGVGVVVNTAVEDGSSVLANGRGDKSLATRVILDEVANIVDDASNSDEGLAILGLLNEIVPADNGKLLEGSSPVELGTLLVKLLLELLNTTLLDLVGAELLQIIGETAELPERNGPLGGIILVPLDSIAVVGWELVVEVVVTLAECDQSSDKVIAGRVAVIEGLVTEPVSQGVNAEGSLLNEANAEDTSVDVATPPITPTETANESREDNGHEDDRLDEVAVLPNNNGVLVEVADIGAALALGVLLHDHPAHVGVEQTLADGVRVLIGVGVAVVGAVTVRPPADGALHGTRAASGEKDFERKGGLVG